MPELKKLGQMIINNKIDISRNISVKLDKRYTQFLENTRLGDDNITNWRAELIGFIGVAVRESNEEVINEEVSKWANQTAEGAITHGIGLDELLKTNKLYREVFWDYLESVIEYENKFPIKKMLKLNKIIDSVLDQTAYIISVSYVRYHQQTLQQARQALLDISTPVVSLTDDVAILPLVGDLDTYRAKLLMETSLKQCIKLKNTHLVIDLSGVPIVDTMVAGELFQVNKALNLIGVKPIFTGIRPDIAQAVIGLGIDFSDITVLGNLKMALSRILEIKGTSL
jgi:rsbT co-antagonist protein RsbR